MLAINRESPMFKRGENFASMMGQAVSLGWIGRWATVYVEDDPFWKDLAKVKEDEIGQFMEKNVGRVPVAAANRRGEPAATGRVPRQRSGLHRANRRRG